MKVKSLLTIYFVTITILVCGQVSIDFGQLTSSWTEGKLDTNGQVIKAEISRGGWKHLNINSDSTVVFSDAFTCGFGHEYTGKWTINKTDSTITFHLDLRNGYMNSPGITYINQIDIYKIELLTTDHLILRKAGQDKPLPFLKTDKVKN